MKKENLAKVYSEVEFVPPLNPRDAFFAGRTNSMTLLYNIKESEQIRYVDVCSLYPWVNKYGTYPVGHPVVVRENFEDVSTYEGIIKCKVLPPEGLFHPVLPYRVGAKLMFPLCRTCAEGLVSELTCEHSDDERSLIGTWVSIELKKAIEKGYKVVEMFEV